MFAVSGTRTPLPQFIHGLIHAFASIPEHSEKRMVAEASRLAFRLRGLDHVGHRKEDIPGKTDYDLYSQEEADFFREQDKRMLDHGKPRHNEEWISYPDGRKVLLDTLKTPYRDIHGNLLGIIGICRDISERKQAEEALRISEERYRHVAESSAGIIWETDATFIVIHLSGRVHEILGYEPEKIIGQHPIFLIDPEDRERVSTLMDRMRLEQKPFKGIEYWCRHNLTRNAIIHCILQRFDIFFGRENRRCIYGYSSSHIRRTRFPGKNVRACRSPFPDGPD